MRNWTTRAAAVVALAAVMSVGGAIAYGGNSYKGQVPPEITPQDWMNRAPTNLAQLKGEVVLLEFWSTT